MLRTFAAFLACLLLAPSPLAAQSPEVQALYAHAQTAQAANQPDRAVADYKKILQLAPDLAPAYNNLGRLYFNLGRYPDAVATLTKGLLLVPDMASADVMLGASYFQMGRLEPALGPLQAGAAALPGDRFAHITLSRVLIGLRRPADAVNQLNTLLAAEPKDQEAWYLLGKLHLQLSQEAFTEVQSLDPNSSFAHVLAGEIMESMSNTPGAVDAYKQALVTAPEDPAALDHLANLYWSTGDWTRSRPALTAVLAHQPGNCNARWKLANTLDQLGESPSAGMDELNRALVQCPDLPQAHAERARLLLRAGKPQQALPDLQIAERAAPDEASLQQLYAQAYRALGDRTRANAATARFAQLEAAQHAAKEHHAASVLQSNQ